MTRTPWSGFSFAAAFLVSHAALAQTAQALISGRITNSLRAGRLRCADRLRRGDEYPHRHHHDRDGFYMVPLLPAGESEFEVDAPGFQGKAQCEIPLGVSLSLELNFALRPRVNF